MNDAYDIIKKALDLWQQNAMSSNDAGQLKKGNFSLPIKVLTPYGYYDVVDVVFDKDHGVLFDARPYRKYLNQD
jgi:hypothetical protein